MEEVFPDSVKDLGAEVADIIVVGIIVVDRESVPQQHAEENLMTL